ncbi:MAG: DUF1015 family protein [Polyangiaceae bacterium]
MADLRPFRAFRPRPDIAERVAAPPYDVISTAEARALAEGNPFSFLHVSRPEIDLPEGTDEHADEVYAKGRENLEALIADGVLTQDAEPRFYVYAQAMPVPGSNGSASVHRQTGIVACAAVADYDADRIKKHEKTRADKEDDRTRHIGDLSAHDEPVFLTYPKVPAIDAVVEAAKLAIPAYDFKTRDGVQHQLWPVDREVGAELGRLFAAVPTLYVADGHHRSAAASRVHKSRKGDGMEHDAFLAVVFPHDQMKIMAYNRVVRDPAGRSPEALLEAIGGVFDLAPTSEPAPNEPKTFGVYCGGSWWRARVRRFDASDPVAALDCSILQTQILEPVLGVKDPRRDAHIDFVGGIRGARELEKRVGEGASIAFHLYPTSIAELIAVSDAGLLMPPKSTWFEPKLRSGLFLHTF